MGKFIAVEGADGSGKSTLVAKLGNWLKDYRQRYVAFTAEPTSTGVGALVRDYLSQKTQWTVGSDTVAAIMKHLMMADRLAHVDGEILSMLARYDFVLCDRYYPSTLVYQTAHIENDDEALGHMIQMRKDMDHDVVDEHGDYTSLRKPDLFVYLGLPEECNDLVAQRLGKRGEPETMYEKLAFQRTIRRRYELWFAEAERGDHNTSVAYIDARFDADKACWDVIDFITKLGWA